MDWMNRGTHPNPATNQAGAAQAPQTTGRRRGDKLTKLFHISSVILLFSATILAVALLFSLVFSSTNKESKFIDKSKLQAVFLNGGQVYFGHIGSLNDKYVALNNIYYLRVNQQVQPDTSTTKTSSNDISLVKLGCELHGPVDQMVINRDQVLFWENLKTDGQVAKAVADYVKANPSGQKCDTTSNSTTQSGSSTTNSTTTPAANSSTTKQ